MSKSGICLIIAGLILTIIVVLTVSNFEYYSCENPQEYLRTYFPEIGTCLTVSLGILLAGIWLITESYRKERKEKQREEEIARLREEVERLKKKEKE